MSTMSTGKNENGKPGKTGKPPRRLPRVTYININGAGVTLALLQCPHDSASFKGNGVGDSKSATFKRAFALFIETTVLPKCGCWHPLLTNLTADLSAAD